jgi:soluble lytic murein transglycosylase-like protein
MDVTTAAVVLLFVISILSGFGNNKGYTPPPLSSTMTGTVYQEVSVEEPGANFSAVSAEAAQLSIQNFILKKRSNSQASLIAESIVRHSQTYDTNPKLVAALIARESRFNPRAVSSSGAVGLGQLLPSTAKNLGVEDPFDVDQNVKGTVIYLKTLITRFQGKVSSAIAAYLEGPNAVSRAGGFSEHTRRYVEDILNIYQRI